MTTAINGNTPICNKNLSRLYGVRDGTYAVMKHKLHPPPRWFKKWFNYPVAYLTVERGSNGLTNLMVHSLPDGHNPLDWRARSVSVDSTGEAHQYMEHVLSWRNVNDNKKANEYLEWLYQNVDNLK